MVACMGLDVGDGVNWDSVAEKLVFPFVIGRGSISLYM